MPQIPYKVYDWLTFKATAKRANAIVVSSKKEWEEAKDFGIDPKKLHLIPMGIDCEYSKEDQPANLGNGPLKILFVGRLARVRRVELLLQAAVHLDIPYHITIVGGEEKTSSTSKSGYLQELRTLCQNLDIQNNVTFAGPKLPDQIKLCYHDHDIFVYPSLYENFGQPLLEAAAAGLPLVSTDVGVAREIVQDGETGFFIAADPRQIAEKIKCLANQKIRNQMGMAICKIVQENFSWDRIIQVYIELYESF